MVAVAAAGDVVKRAILVDTPIAAEGRNVTMRMESVRLTGMMVVNACLTYIGAVMEVNMPLDVGNIGAVMEVNTPLDVGRVGR